MDITETDEDIKVCAEIPGVHPKDINVSVEDGTPSIKAEKKNERDENEKGQFRIEFCYGAFERTIVLPAEVDESNAKTEFKKGALKLRLPKRRNGIASKRIPIT
ncbi:MAG TPA: Hsp20/alpha crystallin family protein [Candidatus Udaeobacter sp.]|nr:Hsp20/alpha crystallin family protein [Candidatus Udaeobacter sp.]